MEPATALNPISSSNGAQEQASVEPEYFWDVCSIPVEYECVVPTAPSPNESSASNADVALLLPTADIEAGPALNPRPMTVSAQDRVLPYCFICGKEFQELRHLQTHIEQHAPFAGDDPPTLSQDQATPLPEAQELPPLPPPTSPSRSSSGKGSGRPALYPCSICSKRFKQTSHLRSHLLLHTGEKPFKCEVCDKRFTQSSHLTIHSCMHTHNRPYQCKQCFKGFAQSSHLKNHMRVHSGERPYECIVCRKRFTQSGHLSNHSRLHSGERPFQCPVCAKKFKQSGHLKYHMRVHDSSPPRSCSVCNKIFSHADHLSNHMRMHIGEDPIECLACEKAFTLRGRLAHNVGASSSASKKGGVQPTRKAPIIVRLTQAEGNESQPTGYTVHHGHAAQGAELHRPSTAAPGGPVAAKASAPRVQEAAKQETFLV